jgi:hypothetical protein
MGLELAHSVSPDISYFYFRSSLLLKTRVAVAQSVQRMATGWMTEGQELESR